MIPSRTMDKVGSATQRIAERFDRSAFYAISGNDLYELAVLAARFTDRWDDANETRDWQNRLATLIETAKSFPL